VQSAVESWSTQQLAGFLAVVSSFQDERSAIQGALDWAAEALDAEIAALLSGGNVEASIGFPAGKADGRALDAVCRGESDTIDIDGVGAADALCFSLADDLRRQLVVARFGSGGFTQEERDLLRGTARVLALTLKMLGGVVKERALRNKAEREMAKRKRAQDEADRLRSEFFASLSHELRTPLTSIIGYTDLLLGGVAGELMPQQREFVEVTARNARRELRLVNDLLFASMSGVRKFKLDLDTVELGTLVTESVESAGLTAEKKRIRLTHKIGSKRELIGDKDRLAQLLDNLISNAIKFTPEGGHAEVRLSEYRDRLQLEVWNSDSFVPPEEQEQLFERFYRSQSAVDKVIPGMGLGLAISKAIVEAHGGAIRVRSDPSEGTSFLIDLPLDAGTSAEPVVVYAPRSASASLGHGARDQVVTEAGAQLAEPGHLVHDQQSEDAGKDAERGD
jgi:signal transduction histidine kinase